MQQLHNNAKTTVHLRKLIQTTCENAKQFCTRHGISLNTFYKWRNRNTTTDTSSKPHRTHKSLTKEDEDFIIELYRITGETGVYLHQVFAQRKNVSLSTIHRLLRKVRVSPEKKTFKFDKQPLGFVHIDVHYLPRIEGIKLYLYVAIERNTRYLYYETSLRKDKKATLHFLEKMLAFFPFEVHTVFSDNGLEFRNALVRQFLTDKNIKHKFGKPYTPRTNGMVERVNRTIESECIKKEQFNTIEELKQALDSYKKFYNNSRYHSALYKEMRVRTPKKAVEKILFV